MFSRYTEHSSLPDWGHLDAEDAFRFDRLLDAFQSGTIGGGCSRCGSALLIGTLVALRWRPDAHVLLGALPHYPDDLSVIDIRSTLARLGFDSKTRKVTGAEILHANRPMLVIDRKGVVWLFSGRHSQDRLFAPDSSGDGWLSRSLRSGEHFKVFEFDSSSVHDNEAQAMMSSSWSMDTLLRFAPEFRFVLLASFVSSCIAVLSAFGVMLIFDNVLPSRNLETLAYVAFGFLLLLAVESSLRRMSGRAIARTSARLEFVFGSGLFAKVLRLPAAMLSASPVGAQLARLRQFQNLRELPASPLAQAVYEIPLALVCLCALAMLAWPLALVLVALITCLFGVVLCLMGPLQRQSKKLFGIQSTATRLIQQIVVDRTQIVRLGMTDQWMDRVEHMTRELVVHRRRHARLTGWLNGLSQASLPIATLAIMGIGAILAINGALSTGQMVGATILTWRMFAVVRQVSTQLARLPDTRETLRQIDVLTRLPQVANPGSGIPSAAIRAAPLRVSNLTFRHPKAMIPTILNATFEIPHGTMAAIVGPSGSGKTTLLRLVAGLADPQSGSVRLGRVNLRQLADAQRSRHIAYISQQPFMFYGTVAQNLRFADPLAPEGKLLEALEECGLGPWLAQLPEGLSTRIDPSRDGGLLRKDIRTSFSIARALLAEPSILLLDEPAGGLGSELEAHMMAALDRRRGELSSLIVTHRPSIMRRADSIVAIQNGQVELKANETPERGRAAS